MPDISYLKIGLPENIARAKEAGDLDFAVKLIDTRLAGDCTQALRERLLLEKERIYRLESDYPYTRQEAFDRLKALKKDLTWEQFEAFELDGSADFHYFGGEKRYFVDQDAAICKMHPELGAGPKQVSDDVTGRNIALQREKGVSSARFRMRASMHVRDEQFVPGEVYTAHLPIPAKAAQISDIRILEASHADYILAPEDAPQRTICFRTKLEKNEEFSVEYEFTNTVRYINAWDPPKEKAVFYPNALPVRDEDTEELLPHIRFSSYLCWLAEELRAGEEDPFLIARNFYDYITCHVRYSYMPSYALMDDIAEYCALNLRGDCGVQALLFIALCRISGIPARWQSGLTCEPEGAGCHDWAQFYTEKYGWLFADPSFGGGGLRRKDEARRRFFFGNIDVCRMPANRAYMAKFIPPRTFTRRDPFDSQTGECETDKRPIPFDGFERRQQVLSMTRLV